MQWDWSELGLRIERPWPVSVFRLDIERPWPLRLLGNNRVILVPTNTADEM